ncbi:DUF1279 superfamily [Lecanora helva]
MKSFQLFRKALRPVHNNFSLREIFHNPRHSPILNRISNIARRRPLTSPLRFRRPYSTEPKKPSYNPTPHLNSPEPSLSLSQRLRKLSREYGWSAFGVYFLLTALDFPFCFAAVRYLGTDRIGHYEHVVVEWLKSVVPEAVVERWRELRRNMGKTSGGKDAERGAVQVGEDTKVESYGIPEEGTVAVIEGFDHGVKEAEKMNKSDNASIWTQLALAYAIHKSFIFIRVPITVAITPKVVKVLRGWGWDIGKRRPKGT